VAATVVGTTAGAALVLLRARGRAKRRRPDSPLDAAEKALRDVFGEARKLLER
jgi:hypothetical protein